MGRRRSRRHNAVLDLLDSLTDLGVKLGGVVFVLVLGYLAYGVFVGQGFVNIANLARPDRLKMVEVVALLCRVMWVSGAVCAVCVTVRYNLEQGLGYIISLLGVALYLGTPFVFGMRFQPQVLAHNPLFSIITGSLRLLGMIVFVPGAILILRDMIMRVVSVFVSRRSRIKLKLGSNFVVGYENEGEKEEYQKRPYAKCWQMPYCRKFVRAACPVFLARRSCWRLKRGCMCDGDIIMKALASQSGEGSIFHKELQYRMGEVPSGGNLTGRQKRMRCRMCVIYEFHQTQKYKLISPAIFPAVIGVLWLLYPTIERLLRNAIAATDQFMKIVAFMPNADSGASNIGMGTPHFVYVAFVVWLGIMSISYALRLAEYCIFTLQI